MKRLLTIMLTICYLSFVLISCGVQAPSNNQGNNTQGSSQPTTPQQPTEPEPEPTAYEKLNANEKIIFDALMINFDKFVAPSTIRITKIIKGADNGAWDNCGDKIPTVGTLNNNSVGISITLKLTGENGNGQKINDYFSLQLYDGTGERNKRGNIVEISDYTLSIFLEQDEFTYANPGKINKAIIEYCEEMGLN